MRKRTKIGYLSIAMVLLVVFIVLTHIPQTKIALNLNIAGLDTPAHLIAYGLIAFFLFMGVQPGKAYHRWIITMIVLSIIAAIDEITQQYTARQASVSDFVANAIGIFCAFINLVSYDMRKGVPPEN